MLEPLMSGDAFHAALEAFRKADENSQDECRSVLIRAYAIAQTRAEIYSGATVATDGSAAKPLSVCNENPK